MIEKFLNPWIRELVPYSSARSEFSGVADVFLDANESWESYRPNLNRYPDPKARALRLEIEKRLGFPFSMTGIGNGSDEIIDLLIRMFASPHEDSIMIERPTYGTYSVFARTQDVAVIDVPLTKDLDLDVISMEKIIEEKEPKLTFICSPNNPTGRVYSIEKIERLAALEKGIIVVDEAYADFSENFCSAYSLIGKHENIVVLRTLSKAYGAAGARIGMLIGSEEVIKVFEKTKPPYNVSLLSEEAGLGALRDEYVKKRIEDVRKRRKEFSSFLESLDYVREVFPSEANFVLFRTSDAKSLYAYLLGKGIVVRDRSSEPMLENTIRVTIGSQEEMERLKKEMRGYGK